MLYWNGLSHVRFPYVCACVFQCKRACFVQWRRKWGSDGRCCAGSLRGIGKWARALFWGSDSGGVGLTCTCVWGVDGFRCGWRFGRVRGSTLLLLVAARCSRAVVVRSAAVVRWRLVGGLLVVAVPAGLPAALLCGGPTVAAAGGLIDPLHGALWALWAFRVRALGGVGL